MSTKFFWVAVIIGALFVIFMLTAPTTEEAAHNNTPTADLPAPQTDLLTPDVDEETTTKLFIGDPDAPVTLIEYGDFKCPSCNQFHQTTSKQLRDEYIDQGLLNIEFRNLPFIGPDSGLAARGTYCAQNQGAFVEYHDALYDSIWVEHYAAGDYTREFEVIFTIDKILEVTNGKVPNSESLRACLESTDVDTHVETDTDQAMADGVRGTPGFVFDGQPVNGPLSFATLKTLIDSKL